MRAVLILSMLAYIFVLGYLFTGRMGRHFEQAAPSPAQRRSRCFLSRLICISVQDASAAERIRLFHREHQRMQARLYDPEISELSGLAD